MIFTTDFYSFLKVCFITSLYMILLHVALCYPMHRVKHTRKRVTRSRMNFYLLDSKMNALSTEPDMPTLTQDKSAALEDDFSHFWSAWHAFTTDLFLATNKPLSTSKKTGSRSSKTPLWQAHTIIIGNKTFSKHYVNSITYPNPTDGLLVGNYQEWVHHNMKHFGSTWSTEGSGLHGHFYELKNLTTAINNNTTITTTAQAMTSKMTPTTTKISTIEMIPTTTEKISTTEMIPTTTEKISTTEMIPTTTNTISTTEMIPTTTNTISTTETTPTTVATVSRYQIFNVHTYLTTTHGRDKANARTNTIDSRAKIALRRATATEQSGIKKYAPYVTFLVAAAAFLGGVYWALKSYKRSRPENLPMQFRQVGTLKNIYAYPVKSCGPVVMTNAECTFLGLRNDWIRDRFLMVINENKHHISARSFPDLLVVQPSIKSSILELRYKDKEPLAIDLAQVSAQDIIQTAYVCGVSVPVKDCGAAASEWVSRLLDPQGKCYYRMVLYASENSRQLTATKQKLYFFTKYDTGALSNEAPFHLINESSVEDLNGRLQGCAVSPRNFRPNLVVSGAQPFDEDKWKYVRIRDTMFAVTKPCYRCIMTAIDPDTAVQNSDHEPLKTLKSYRQSEGPEARRLLGVGPRMGVHLALRPSPHLRGSVAVNDPVFAADDPCWRDHTNCENANQKPLQSGKIKEGSPGGMNVDSTGRNQGWNKLEQRVTTPVGADGRGGGCSTRCRPRSGRKANKLL